MGVACGLHLLTTGTQGPSLGSDETPTCLLAYLLVDINTNKVLGTQEYVIRCGETSVLSEQTLAESRLNQAIIQGPSSITLHQAVHKFDSYCRGIGVNPTALTLVTDGQLPLRQVLHPEACRQQWELPPQYSRFADLRKDLSNLYRAHHVFSSIPEMTIFLDIPHSGENEFMGKEVKDMLNVMQRLIADGHKFTTIETINLVLEPGICTKDEEVDSNCVVRARGLPWQSSDQDIAKFFRGLNVAKGGVALCLSPMGRRNGEALVRFTCSEHRDMALKRHKHHIGARYIEVYRASGDDFVSVAGGSNNEAQAFLTRGAQVIIRMRGLPYDCTAQQVMEFFESGEEPCSVMDGEEGVLFVRKPDGRSTGDAFVLFREESEAGRALARHRELIGTRYIELFRSTTAEVQQVLNRTMESFEGASNSTPSTTVAAAAAAASAAALLPVPQVPLLPQHIITSGTRKDCIRLRGLPYEAQVEHILDFLGDHAKSIVFQGVHMVYNSQGQPSGEAFIQMESEASAFAAAQLRHHRYMTFGKKQRYIEVFQCSGEDMNLVLTGGLPGTPGQLSPVGKTLLSPGGTMQVGPHHFAAAHYGLRYFPPAPPPPPLLYWPYPSPPVSPPPPPPTLLIMRHDNYLEHWGLDYMTGQAALPQTLGLHSAAA